MGDLWNQIQTAVLLYLPNVLLAVGILIVGWLVALLLSSLVRNLLERTNIDDRLARTLGNDPNAPTDKIQVEKWIGTAVFWLVILFTLVIFFQVLNIPAVSGPLNNFLDQIVLFLPGLLGGLILLGLAWLVATILRALVVKLLNASGLTRRLSADADVKPQDRISISQTIGNVVYWLVFLLFLPAILNAFRLQGLLQPVQSLVDDILSFLPNLLGAALILVIGWFVARIVRQIVTNLLSGLGADRLGEQVGLSGTTGNLQLSNVIGTIVYVLILVPVAIAALNALDIPAVSEPASAMLTDLLNALPAIFGAFLLLAIAYFVARLVGRFVATILDNIGFNQIFDWLGIYKVPPAPSATTTGVVTVDEPQPGRPASAALTSQAPSDIVGYLVTVGIMLFAVMEAANLLGFEILAVMVSEFIAAALQVLFGLIIFGIGLYLANLAERVIRSSGGEDRRFLATAARIAILIFTAALALREMGIAASIVNLAFGLLLGAVAVAIALAFGLGGREIAARQLENWREDLEGGVGGGVVTPPGTPRSPEE